MANLTAGIAASTGTSATKTQSRAVTLNVTKTLAMVALFGFSRSWQRAAVGLMACGKLEWVSCRESGAHTWLLAVVAKTLRRGANFSKMPNISALKASTARERRHSDEFVGLLGTIVSKTSHERAVVRGPLPEDLLAPVRRPICAVCL